MSEFTSFYFSRIISRAHTQQCQHCHTQYKRTECIFVPNVGDVCSKCFINNAQQCLDQYQNSEILNQCFDCGKHGDVVEIICGKWCKECIQKSIQLWLQSF